MKHTDPNRIGVSAIFTSLKGEVLVMDHVKAGSITIPVGKGDDGETPEQAIVREMKEELGVEITEMSCEQIGWKDGRNPIFDHDHFVFTVIEYKGAIVNLEPTKHRWVKFASKKAILDFITDSSTMVMKYLKEVGFFNPKPPKKFKEWVAPTLDKNKVKLEISVLSAIIDYNRKKQGIRQGELADALNMSQSAVSRLMGNDGGKTAMEDIYAVCVLLKLNFAVLMMTSCRLAELGNVETALKVYIKENN
jgi:8-oxo-dGTP pyrophosphatase MutT (NUDIX family)